MFEELGILKVNRLTLKDAKILADYMKRLVQTCSESKRMQEEHLEEYPAGVDDDPMPKNFGPAIDKVAAHVPVIQRNMMHDKAATKAYKDIKALLKICDDLNGYDLFGTEGWQHRLGLD